MLVTFCFSLNRNSILRWTTKSGTSFRSRPLQVQNSILKRTTKTPFRGRPLSLEETDLGISKVQNSNSKRTEVQIKPRLYLKMKDILRTRKPGVLLTSISKIHGWISKRNFEGPELLLKQTNYLKAHSFPDANKRWGRIKVRVGSKKLKLFVGIKPTGTISKPLTT
ncbi:hypothetical protein RclHR1_25300002 [Rhizophagus clarus]|uniref:Uncharacterized protein n=1 Tax=Rhizophagus clarus TaxID=94130 RepID=A0A2Z6RTY9_9GLOM|nr:hypothetical protein RclHR1_25300002 [Rhizophagus clarus]